MRRTLLFRSMVTMSGVAAVATLLVLGFQERSLARSLERAATARLERATRAADRLLEGHLTARTERWRTVSATPQVRATLELADAPTAEHLARTLLERHGAAAVHLLDPAGAVLAEVGAVGIGVAAGQGSTLWISQRQPFVVTRIPVAVAGSDLGSLVVVEAVRPALLEEWSELCGARVSVAGAGSSEPGLLTRTVRALGDMELRVSSDLAAERRAMASARWQLGLAGGLALLFALAASLWLSRGLVRPILELQAAAERVGRGDLTGEIDAGGPEEIRAVALAFARMAGSLRETLGRVAVAADRVDGAASQMSGVSERLTRVVGEQTRGQALAAESMARVNDQVDGIFESAAASAEALDRAVHGSSRSSRDLEQTCAELARAADELQAGTEAITEAIDEMSAAAAATTEQIETVLPALDQTAGSVQSMARSAEEVAASAGETAELSRTMVETADRGRSHVLQTVAGMDEIRESTLEAQDAVQQLGRGVKEIGAFLTEIDEVADESELLALNAAIIAAQAGEHGRAFSVVAEQMKELADRVMGGTTEIYRLVSALHTGMSRATGAIDKGSARVRTGAKRAELAGESLEEITEAARRAGERMAEIAEATAAQTRSTHEVTLAMEQVRGGAEAMRVAGREQAHGSVRGQESAASLRDVAARVRQTITSQTEETRRIGDGIETVQRSVGQINGALKEQLEACREASRTLEGLREHTLATEAAAAETSDSTHDLVRQAEDLRADVRRFDL